ncbi:MAG: hypothetical protein HOK41_10175 [Nitrospina sp.]|jgi:hypothetical protein|nr:hypothetical protein [Nitrospina sp.]MBT6718612.1 hypothetical protein [Nitrospina sp.]
MANLPKASGPVFSDDHLINLYYINELYRNIGAEVSVRLKEIYGLDIPLTAGVWGGTYLIAKPNGLARRRIWRLYSIVNLPQNSPLDKQENMEKLVAVYADAYKEAFAPYKLELALKMWGGTLPYSNKAKPSLTMHMEDATDRVRWLRTFFVWNSVPWEESIICDTVRIIKEYKEFFDLKKGQVKKDPKDIKYLLQDIIIIYRTLENACSENFREHATPIIKTMMTEFMAGLHDPDKIKELYEMVFDNALIYGFEESLEEPYRKEGLDIHQIQKWPMEKINWVPEELKEKLIPPIQEIFSGFKKELETTSNS